MITRRYWGIRYFLLLLATALAMESAYSSNSENVAVGQIDAVFDVSSQGSATYSIPIITPPGTAGLTPSISLTYNSQSPSSSVGIGWTVEGLHVITRGPKNLGQDGKITRVQFTEDDAFYFNGQRLIPTATSRDNSYIEYRTLIDDGSRIRGFNFTNQGPSEFEVKTKSGLTILLGNSAGSRITLDGKVLAWVCETIEDTLGNYIQFSYLQNNNGDYNIDQITYTGNRSQDISPYAAIEFTYSENPHPIESYFVGYKIVRSKVLERIETRFNDQPMFEYRLEHSRATGSDSFKLDSVTQYGADGKSYRPTKFTYSETKPEWKTPTEWQNSLPSLSHSNVLADSTKLVDLNGDGLSDFMYASAIGGDLESFAVLATDGGWSNPSDATHQEEAQPFASPIPFSNESGPRNGILFVDINGDGKNDLLEYSRFSNGTEEQHAFLHDPSGWKSESGLVPPIPTANNGSSEPGLILLDADGNGNKELIYSNGIESSGYKQKNNHWDEEPDLAPPRRFAFNEYGQLNGTYSLDVDCDGSDDLVYHRLDQDGNTESVAYNYSERTGWEEFSDQSFIFPFAPIPGPKALALVDINQDGCKDLLLSYRHENTEVRGVWLASKSGWTKSEKHTPPFILYVSEMGKALYSGVQFVHLNDDGLLDVVANSNGTNQAEFKFAFLNTLDGWSSAELYIPPQPIYNPETESNAAKFADLNGDKLSDVVYLSNPEIGPNTLINVGNGWSTPSTDYTPPVEIAKSKEGDKGVRFVDLNGDGLIDIVLHKEGAGESSSFINSGQKWEPNKRYAPPKAISNDKGDDLGARLIDVNSDGLADYVYAKRGDTAEVYLNSGDVDTGWLEKSSQWPADIAFVDSTSGDLGAVVIDLNGDGRNDIIASHRDGTLNNQVFRRAYLNMGDHWQEAPEFQPCYFENAHEEYDYPVKFCVDFSSKDEARRGSFGSDVYTTERYRWLNTQITDLNGDRLPDLLFSYELSFTAPSQTPINCQKNDDICLAQRKNEIYKSKYAGALINTGSGWKYAPDFIPKHRLDHPIRPNNPSHPLPVTQTNLFNDINGDGLIDHIHINHNDGTSSSSIYLNTGNGWTENVPTWQLPANVVAKKPNNPGFAFIDLNGDSLVDILYSRKTTKDGNAESGVHFNLGGRWSPVASSGPSLILNDYINGDPGTRILDVNGDGLPDLIQSFTDAENKTQKHVLLNRSADSKTGGRSDILTRIDEGMGQRINIRYRSQSENAGWRDNGIDRFYSRGGPVRYPLVNVSMPLHGVDNVKIEERNNTLKDPFGYRTTSNFKYSYSGYRIDMVTGESRGYQSRISLNNSPLKTTKTEANFYQDFGRSGLTSKEQHSIKRDDQFRLLRTIVNDWTKYPLHGMSNSTGTSHNYWVTHLTRSTTQTYDINHDKPLSIQNEEYHYSGKDGFQNVVKTVISRSDGAKTTTTSDYEDDNDKWIKGRVSKTTVDIEHSDPNKQSQSRTAEFNYSEKTGLLEQEISLSGSQFSISTYHIHDKFGNTIQTITCPTATAGDRDTLTTIDPERAVSCGTNRDLNNGEPLKPRLRSFEYDALGRIVRADYNALHHRTTVVASNEIFGIPTVIEDANGVAAKSSFDSLGQLIESESSTKVKTKITRSFLPPNERGAAYAVETHVYGLPPTSRWLDSKGRELRTISIGEDNRRVVIDNYYDIEGRLVEKALPRFEGDPVFSSKTNYDLLGRPTSIIGASGQVACYYYDRNTTIHIDFAKSTEVKGSSLHPSDFCEMAKNDNSKGRRTISRYDLDNNLLSVTDALGGIVQYEYDIAGRVVEINNNNRSKIVTRYDYAGNKSELIDPDMGHWYYRYNAYTELVYQKDAKEQETYIKYDQIGRLLYKRTSDSSLENKYDDKPFAKGKLIAVLSSDGHQEHYQYDEHSRITGVTTHIQERKFISLTTYDALNRVTEVQYPTGFVVKNHFDKLGFFRCVSKPSLNSCDDAAAGSLYWSGKYNATGQLVSETFGNNVTTTNQYFANTGLTKAILTQDKNKNPILDETYLYDLGGNLESRTTQNLAQKLTLSYEYDALDRLVSQRENGIEKTAVEYDLVGNILSKSGVGSYAYGDKDGPVHGVSSITRGVGEDAIVSKYRYDANGNLVKSDQASLSYNASNQVVLIQSSGSKWSKFKYSASGRKYFQDYSDILRSVQTTYVGNYEEVKEVMVPPFMPTSERLRKRHFIVGGSGVVGAYEEITWFFPTRHFPEIYKHTFIDSGERSSIETSSISYFHNDYLGSLSAITDSSGQLVQKLRYDPWGKRIQDKKRQYHTFTNGFTGHEQLDNVGFIHMNGRVYDPDIGRFVSADPFVQFPSFGQSFNRYSYVLNNPLKFTDPTGFWSLGRAIGGVLRGAADIFAGGVRAIGDAVFSVVGPPLEEFGRFMNKHGRTLVAIAGGIIVGVATGNPYAGAAAYGFLSGAANGASFEESLKMAAISAATAYIMGNVADYAKTNWGAGASYAAQGATGGAISHATGGNFSRGFWSAGIAAAFAPPQVNNGQINYGTLAKRAIIGGAVSRINNGKFENGAVAASFDYMFSTVTTRRGLSAKGEALLKSIEELRLQPYDDQTGKTITSWVKGATIGYGHLISKSEWSIYENGITAAQADALFTADLAPFVAAVNSNISSGVSQQQFDAAVILAYNIGVQGFSNSSVLALINNPSASTPYSNLESAWKAWNKSQGVVNQGLINRRNAEWDIYSKGIYNKW